MKTINNFITTQEAEEILNSSFLREKKYIENDHIREVNAATNGWTILYDITKTPISQEVSKFQGDTTQIASVPSIFITIADRISQSINISNENVFFQYISLGSGGQVKKHYDAGKPGYITYKCNICIDGPDIDCINVDRVSFPIRKFDLYCFEANLYKHWMEISDKNRIHLSYGFIIPCNDLGWKEKDPRIKLSNRIWSKYINQ